MNKLNNLSLDGKVKHPVEKNNWKQKFFKSEETNTKALFMSHETQVLCWILALKWTKRKLAIGYNHTEVTKRQGSVAENWTLTQNRMNIGGQAHIIIIIGICVKHTCDCYCCFYATEIDTDTEHVKTSPARASGSCGSPAAHSYVIFSR